jgi:DNA-directed RNA polymerase specialized sigma24 family protein
VDIESAELVARWRQGDQRAADLLFQRYVQRLLALARRRLSPKLAQRLDPEDVVQSAYRSFFVGARAGRYVLERSGDLWRLLAAITLHKLQRQVEYHSAGKRDQGREQTFRPEDSLCGLAAEVVAHEPTPEEAAAVLDELELVLRGLEPLHRRMVELQLQGHLLEEIAAETQRSERLVRLVLGKVRQHLEQRCREQANP